MNELKLKYGVNPNQGDARVFVESGKLPFEVLNGQSGYINLLDALNAWQLVSELSTVFHMPAAASFKHVSPSGAALGLPLSEVLKKAYFCEQTELSPIACAYARARGTDRMSSFGDFIALSDECDESAAQLIKSEVSDGIIAPSYSKEALEILKAKREGKYCIIKIDCGYVPSGVEQKTVFGITFEQKRNDITLGFSHLDNIVTANKALTESAKRDLLIALITLKYTQSNSVCYTYDGQTIGVGAGQQSRIHCTRLAGDKADGWFLRQHPKALGLDFLDGIKRAERDNAVNLFIDDPLSLALVWQKFLKTKPLFLIEEDKALYLSKIDGVVLGSDAFFPFADNIERAHMSGVTYVAQPGGSKADAEVIRACNDKNMVMVFTGIRLFHH
jgi:phosphoribosylaminoimidazolecarboxamide formyltransferase/IMP cyclohydrolase